ncbi:MAG: 4-hydroxythreonine-4-phosphate dehydrogenase PdxA [Hyphomicrobium sp.]
MRADAAEQRPPMERSVTSAPLALTMGDPAGIGLEISIKSWLQRQTRGLPPFVLIAGPDSVTAAAVRVGAVVPVEVVTDLRHVPDLFHASLPVFPVALGRQAEPGIPDASNASSVIGAIEMAVELAHHGRIAGIVTNPISKAVLKSAGFAFPGHTEFLAHLAARHHPGKTFRAVMMLASDELKVVPLTIHIPLADVPRAVTPALIAETVRITWRGLNEDFGIPSPRIAIAGLNPHAGESGTMGREETEVIAPTIARLASEGLSVSGPFPADTLFHSAARRRYDAVVAMYHDQALIPLKTLAFDRGVNITLGLPFVRTSPDHGTAFDIAGKGIANPESLMQALLAARRMADCRQSRAISPVASP